MIKHFYNCCCCCSLSFKSAASSIPARVDANEYNSFANRAVQRSHLSNFNEVLCKKKSHALSSVLKLLDQSDKQLKIYDLGTFEVNISHIVSSNHNLYNKNQNCIYI